MNTEYKAVRSDGQIAYYLLILIDCTHFCTTFLIEAPVFSALVLQLMIHSALRFMVFLLR